MSKFVLYISVYDYESCVKQQIRNKIIMTMSRFDEHIKSYLRQMGYPYRALLLKYINIDRN